MADSETQVVPRADAHGENMAAEVVQHGIHCHDCWKYTDDMRRDGDLLHEAVAIIVNGGTLCVEQSEAFKAADAYLAAKFKALTSSTPSPTVVPLGAPFRLR